MKPTTTPLVSPIFILADEPRARWDSSASTRVGPIFPTPRSSAASPPGPGSTCCIAHTESGASTCGPHLSPPDGHGARLSLPISRRRQHGHVASLQVPHRHPTAGVLTLQDGCRPHSGEHCVSTGLRLVIEKDFEFSSQAILAHLSNPLPPHDIPKVNSSPQSR